MERSRDNIIIGLMVILTYFLIYTFMNGSSTLESLGGLPLINCTTDLIQNGFSGSTIATITKDFGQTILIIYIVVFVQNLLPVNDRRPGAIVGTIIGYIVLYLIAMWIVRYIIFSSKMNDIIKMFISIVSVIAGGLGALFSTPLRRIIAEHIASQVLREFVFHSRVVRWLANSFFITCVILFLAISIEMTVGLPYFFAVILAGFPAIIMLGLMMACLYLIIRVH